MRCYVVRAAAVKLNLEIITQPGGAHEPATTPKTAEPVLCVAFELGATQWKMAFSLGQGQAPRVRTVQAGDLEGVQWEIARAKERFGLGASAEVASCYEAGREGFWLHRALKERGVENRVVDSASIEVSRRKRRIKTDRLDAEKLVGMLLRYRNGERPVWSVVRVPTPEEEDRRQLHRELKAAQRDRTRITNRIKGLLFGQGIRLRKVQELPKLLQGVRLWNGEPLGEGLRARLEREWKQVVLLTQKIRELVSERRKRLRTGQDEGSACARKLVRLGGIGPTAAWLFALEFFSWRQFRNRRQVGALAGLAPSPYRSGDDAREQGISKAGNRWIRAVAIEIAWSWLRYQPQSELSLWYRRRFGSGGARMRKIGIVALARKLLIELWKYLQTGTPPAGAVLKPSPLGE